MLKKSVKSWNKKVTSREKPLGDRGHVTELLSMAAESRRIFQTGKKRTGRGKSVFLVASKQSFRRGRREENIKKQPVVGPIRKASSHRSRLCGETPLGEIFEGHWSEKNGLEKPTRKHAG